jgi:2-oxo-3-hexenedioate decarboxylase
MLSRAVIIDIARRLDEAQQCVRPINKVTDEHPSMEWEDAYAIQDELRAFKVGRGISVTGLKMGFTSLAKMDQMGVHEPIYGFLTDERALTNDSELSTQGLIHPKIEPEVAFLTRYDLRGPGCHIGAVLAATQAVIPALEIIDSRYEAYRFDLKSVVADNTSAAGYVLGDRHADIADLDLKNLGVVVEKNGAVVSLASGAAVLGHPAQSVATLANMLARRGDFIPAATLILTGGLTEAVAVHPGDVIEARFQNIGNLTLNITN